MTFLKSAQLIGLLFATPALAYLPPAFFLYTRIAEQHAKTNVGSVVLSVSRPQASGTEELLGTVTVAGWGANSDGGWPTLSLIFDNNVEALENAVSAFGLSVAPESELMRVSREQLNSMKEPPVPFYKTDPTVSLQRARQTYAWVHGNRETGKSVWVEKDTFLPLKIAGPCPPAAASLGWAKTGENKCEMEFRNLFALRRGNPQNTRLTLWKDGAPLLFFSFEKVSPKSAPPADSLPSDIKEIALALLH